MGKHRSLLAGPGLRRGHVIALVTVVSVLAALALFVGKESGAVSASTGSEAHPGLRGRFSAAEPNSVPPRAESADWGSRKLRGPVATPDLLILSPVSLNRRTADAIGRDSRVNDLITLDGGQTRVAGVVTNTMGVDPSAFRRWTPLSTASAGALWSSLAEGGFVADPQLVGTAQVRNGTVYPVAGSVTVPMPLSAVRDVGVPGVGIVVARQMGARLGLVPDAGILIDAREQDIEQLAGWVREQVGSRARVISLGGIPDDAPISRAEGTARPQTYLDLYRRAAARCPGLPWPVLAAIGQIESGHGRNNGPSSAGALGPMQFMPQTWEHYGTDGDGDGRRDIMDPYDAITAAADYLCRHGAGHGSESLRRAIFAYNHADWYVRQVIALAHAYSREYQ